MNDFMLVEMFSFGRKCKNSSWSNFLGYFLRIFGMFLEVFGKLLF